LSNGATSTFLLDASAIMLVGLRWLVLVASTVLVLFVTWLILSLIWSQSDSKTISIRPFVVVDPSGNLKNAETGFAQILSAQMAELQTRVLQARALLRDAASGQILSPQLETSMQVPTDRRTQPKIVDAPWPEVSASEQRAKLDLKVEGVDVSGLVSWIRAQLVHERKGLAFTAHISSDGTATIAGDVSDMGIKGVRTLYMAPAQLSPVTALNNLALHLFQLRLVGDDPRLRDLPIAEFGTLVDRLSDTADPRLDTLPEADRKQRYRKYSAYFASLSDTYSDWQAVMILTAETARRGGDYDAAQKHLQLAINQENRVAARAERLRLLRASLAAVSAPAAAQTRTSEALSAKPALIPRLVIHSGDATGIDTLRAGFRALYDEKGEGSYAAVAGLYGVPGWYSWGHQSSSRSNQHLNLFLPWHRAFLANLERAARERVKDFALMCWDPTQGGIPPAFTEGSADNPLKAYYINLPQSNPPITRFTTRSPAPATDLPNKADVEEVLANTTWDDFSPSLEDLSDRIHGWTSGDMGIRSLAAYDPLFYAHHCQIDRLWALWQLKQPALDAPNAIDKSLLDVVLEPFGIKVRDVLDITKLGYEYKS
jgi:tyrosinase